MYQIEVTLSLIFPTGVDDKSISQGQVVVPGRNLISGSSRSKTQHRRPCVSHLNTLLPCCLLPTCAANIEHPGERKGENKRKSITGLSRGQRVGL